MSMDTDNIKIRVEFGGGLELLFANRKSLSLTIPSQVPVDNNSASVAAPAASAANPTTKPVDLTYLMYYLKDRELKERPELFMEEGTVRPGILVLINDTDWELEGEGDYALKNGDEIVFISTLHGG
ncbi:hypothetical protein AX16_002964 [Volvariella volvacea WC 439]|nr:hypothetical protein AX16_002964 [Volvariella volvacea WC 439]